MVDKWSKNGDNWEKTILNVQLPDDDINPDMIFDVTLELTKEGAGVKRAYYTLGKEKTLLTEPFHQIFIEWSIPHFKELKNERYSK